MPELPDVDVYVDTIGQQFGGQKLQQLRIGNPFVLRSVAVQPQALAGKCLLHTRRIGKRVALGFDDDYWAVVHLMVAGRFQHKSKAPSLGSRNALVAFDFGSGSLLLTEAGTKKRASLYLEDSAEALRKHDPGGVEPLGITAGEFAAALQHRNHTLKRGLTDPRIFSGIGNACSDEILHAARLSPVQLTGNLSTGEIARLFEATTSVLEKWRERLMEEANGEIPRRVTAFRPDMAVHGKYGKPCPVCDEPVQRIRYKSNETNYCARCQTGGRLLKDRALSRLLHQDWPKSLDDL